MLICRSINRVYLGKITWKIIERVEKMKTLKLITISAILSFTLFSVHSIAYGNEGTQNQNEKNVQLTDEQKEELNELHMELMELRKELIEKYIEFGVISEEKGKKMIEHMEKHYEKLKENGFIPRWHKHRPMPPKENDQQ